MKNVSSFYNKKGWQYKNDISLDSSLFEDNREVAKKYIKNCRLKVLDFIPSKGLNFLDFASGPIQYQEYLKYSKNFKLRHCVDFSRQAIKVAKKKLKKKGKYYPKDFMKINFPNNFFDCTLSMHTIYHMNKKIQEKAVKKLIRITKPKRPIIIIYSNPKPLLKIFYSFFLKRKKSNLIYFYCYPPSWWKRFEKNCDVKFYSWRSFSSKHQKILFPNNIIGKFLFEILFFLEKKFSSFFAYNFQYPIIVLKKK